MPKPSARQRGQRTPPYFDRSVPPLNSNARLGRFAHRYDLSAISPRRMVHLSTELFVSGYLTQAQHEDLSFQAELMPNFDVTIGALTGKRAEPDRARNFTEIWRQRLEFEKNHAAEDERIIKRTQKILDLLETIESQPTQLPARLKETLRQPNNNREKEIKAGLKKHPLRLS